MTTTPRLAIFPGSFDPFTVGHADLVARAAALFDGVIIAVLVNADKRPMFPLEERLAMIRDVTAGTPGVEVTSFQGLLVDFARARGACAVVRGVRSAVDLAYEQPMAQMNRHLRGDIDTVFLAASPARAFVSSTLVRDVIALGGPLDGLVPDAVRRHIEQRRVETGSRKV